MKAVRRRKAQRLICLLLLTGFAGGVAADDRASPADGTAVMPGVVVVKLKSPIGEGGSKTGVPSLDALVDKLGVVAIEPAFSFVRKAGKRGEGLQQIYNFQYRGPASPQQVAAHLARDPHVEYAEPRFIYPLHGVTAPPRGRPNDALFGEMQHLLQVRAPEAWDVVRGDQGTAVIAIVDGGTDWRHEDLRANVWFNPGEIEGNGLDDDGNGFVDDVHGWNFASNSADPTGLPETPSSGGHGTVVAGVAAAVTDNNLGVAGMSWNARFMPVNAACPLAGLDGSICFGFEAIAYAAANGAAVINASWGGRARSRVAQDVIDFAYAQGALLVTSAGNGGSDGTGDSNDLVPQYPSNYNHVLAVGATGKADDGKAGFSNYGVTVDVYAPGVGVVSTGPDGQYASFASGTSFSSPIVAALAVLVKTQHPGWTVDQVREQVRATADAIDGVNAGLAGHLGKGRVNAFRAVTENSALAVRLAEVAFLDSGGDGDIDAGEIIQVSARFTSFLADVAGLSFELTTDDPFVTILNGSAGLSALASGDTATVSFSFTLAEAAPEEYAFAFITRVQAGTYTDADLFELFANPAAVITHDTGRLQASLTSQGNIGWTGFANESGGVGFVFEGENLLFEGGILVGTQLSQVSDNLRGSDGSTQQNDFKPEAGSSLRLVAPGEIAAQESALELVDEPAARPLGVRLVQQSAADTTDGRRDFVILQYILENPTSQPIDNLHLGLFLDWDLKADGRDHGRSEVAARLGWVQDEVNTSNATRLAGTKLLAPYPSSHSTIDNQRWLYDGFTEAEKWAFLQTRREDRPLNNLDVSSLMAVGPLRLDPGCQAEIAFAVLGGHSEAAFRQSAEAAQAFWDGAMRPLIPNRAPAFTNALEDRTIREGELFSFVFEATEPDACDHLHFSLFEAPPNAVIDERGGAFMFEPDLAQAGQHPVVVVVSDGLETDTTRALFTVLDANRLPAFSATLPDTTVVPGQTLLYTFQAIDADGDPILYGLIDAPAGAALDATTGIFTFNPTANQLGSHLVTVSASDGVASATVEATVTVAASSFALEALYPNPAAPPIDFQYRLLRQSRVRLEVFDVLGRRVRTLVDGVEAAGLHTLAWNGRDDAGRPVAGGLYFTRLVASSAEESLTQTRTLVLLR